MRDLERRQSAGRVGDGRRTRRWLLASISLALAVAALFVTAACGEGGEEGVTSLEDTKALGPADAAVTVIEYSDFQ